MSGVTVTLQDSASMHSCSRKIVLFASIQCSSCCMQSFSVVHIASIQCGSCCTQLYSVFRDVCNIQCSPYCMQPSTCRMQPYTVIGVVCNYTVWLSAHLCAYFLRIFLLSIKALAARMHQHSHGFLLVRRHATVCVCVCVCVCAIQRMQQ